MLLNIAARRTDFGALHAEGYFLLPTAWDLGSARRLEAMGFAALATSNTSLAYALGRDDGHITRDEVLAHLRLLVSATEIAVNADFGSGFATDAAELRQNIRLAIDTGIAGLSIKDGAGDGLDDPQQTVARIRIARDVITRSGADVLLVGRSEGPPIGRASVNDTIERLVAYSKAGAGVLCASGLSRLADVSAVVEAVAPKPVDVQVTSGMRAAELGDLGVRRITPRKPKARPPSRRQRSNDSHRATDRRAA